MDSKGNFTILFHFKWLKEFIYKGRIKNYFFKIGLLIKIDFFNWRNGDNIAFFQSTTKNVLQNDEHNLILKKKILSEC